MIIGSTAIKHHFPDFHREPNDLDVISDVEIESDKRVEYHNIPPLPRAAVISPNDLYTLKMSHLFWDINWEKHMFDVQFLRKKGCVLDRKLFFRLYSFWCHKHGVPKRSNLNLKAEDFFDNALKEYDHDHLHTLLRPTPTYLLVLKDGCEVEPDEHKFNALSHEQKCDLVQEEVMVMAFERRGNRNYRKAYSWMLKRFIIHHAPIWEAIFIIENYIELHRPLFNYFKTLEDGLKNSIERPAAI